MSTETSTLDTPKIQSEPALLHYVRTAFINSGNPTRPLCGVAMKGSPVSVDRFPTGNAPSLVCPDCLLIYVLLPNRGDK